MAWSRTSLAVLLNGVLLIAKDLPYGNAAVQTVAAGFAGIIAVAVYLIGLQRQKTLARRPLPHRITAHGEVQFAGVAVLALITVTALSLVV